MSFGLANRESFQNKAELMFRSTDSKKLCTSSATSLTSFTCAKKKKKIIYQVKCRMLEIYIVT